MIRPGLVGLVTVAGGIGYIVPDLIPDFRTATAVAGVVAVFELAMVARSQGRLTETPPFPAAAKVMLGGGLVLATGILSGDS